jgi:hypothetical protein
MTWCGTSANGNIISWIVVFDEATIARWLRTIRATRRLMRCATALVLSTPYLAKLASVDVPRPIFVSPNVLSREQIALSQRAFEERQPHRLASAPVIGYFCGHAHVHDEDLASVGAALRAVMETYSDARLRFYGELSLPPELMEPTIRERIELLPVVDWLICAPHRRSGHQHRAAGR